jgi:K+-transporting ATPase ATPase A chain
LYYSRILCREDFLMGQAWLLALLLLATATALAIPVGRYLAWLFDGRYAPPAWLRRVEQQVDTGPQSWKQYAVSLLVFSTLTFVIGFVVLAVQPCFQGWPLNPDRKPALGPTTIFHTSISFFTNNSQQHYSGEQHLSYLSQLVAIVWNMFVSGAAGLCALVAVIRGLRGDAHLGNFYLDLWRAVVYVLLPGSVVLAVLFLAAGAPMTFEGAAVVTTLEQSSTEAGSASTQLIARGPVAVLVPVKNLASVGGGFFGANSAHPYENPNAWTNFLTCVSILLLPCALVVTFGKMLAQPRHALIIYVVLLVLLGSLIAWTIYWETGCVNPAIVAHKPTPVTLEHAGISASAREAAIVASAAGQAGGLPRLWQAGWVAETALKAPKQTLDLAELPIDQLAGNEEGKELRFGPGGSPMFVTATTAVSCGSVNCMHDSLNPLTGLTPLAGMWLNCVFGGVGTGLINLLHYLILGLFLTGLMVGRTPEYLGKKLEQREMKLTMLALLSHPLLILIPTGLCIATAWGNQSISNPGTHGLSQVIYEFSSASSGNGSGFEGLGDTWGFKESGANNTAPAAPYSRWWDISCGLVMLLSRFIPIIATLALASSLAAKQATPMTVGTVRTDTITFGVVLLVTILLLGALLFLPVIALGPVAEHLGPIPFGG